MGHYRIKNMSPETPYESRFFTVLLNEKYEITDMNTDRITSVNNNKAIGFAKAALKKKSSNGFVGDFRYFLHKTNDGYRIIFLDCGRRLESFKSFLYTSIMMMVVGLFIAFIVIFISAGKIIKPIAESYYKQKRFITDAGHEIKTPLTIISANVELLQDELGENESLADIKRQTNRLRSLTNDLVMLARMEEAEGTLQKIEFPISEVVSEAVIAFKNVAVNQGKEFVYNVEPMLTLNGNAKAIIQLVDILADNAIKYSPKTGKIVFNMSKNGRMIVIQVLNETNNQIDKYKINQVFERFYRMDTSRNSNLSGSGIGLSIAQAIVNAHGGKIQAWTKDGHSFRITASFPT